MILVDISVWVDHLQRADAAPMAQLEAGQVMAHSFVIGELACGNLGNRREVFSLLHAFPRAPLANDEEALWAH